MINTVEATYTLKEFMKEIKEEFKLYRENFDQLNNKIESLREMEIDTYHFVKEQKTRIDSQEVRISALENNHSKIQEKNAENLWKSKGLWGMITGISALIIEVLYVWATMRGYK